MAETIQQIAICLAPAIIVAIIAKMLIKAWLKDVYRGTWTYCSRKAKYNRWDRHDLRNYY